MVEGRVKSNICEQREEKTSHIGRKPDRLTALRTVWPLSDGASPTRVAFGDIWYRGGERRWGGGAEWASISTAVEFIS